MKLILIYYSTSTSQIDHATPQQQHGGFACDDEFCCSTCSKKMRVEELRRVVQEAKLYQKAESDEMMQHVVAQEARGISGG